MEEEDMQYGSWLRASPIKSRRRNAEGELQEERKLLLAFKNRKAGSCAKAKLDFSTACGDDHNLVGGSSQMLVDGEEMTIPSGEVSKRRMIEKDGGGERENIRFVEGVVQGPGVSLKKAEVAMQPRPVK